MATPTDQIIVLNAVQIDADTLFNTTSSEIVLDNFIEESIEIEVWSNTYVDLKIINNDVVALLTLFISSPKDDKTRVVS